MQLPIGEEGDFCGVVDLLEEHVVAFNEGDFGAALTIEPIADEFKAAVAEAREAA